MKNNNNYNDHFLNKNNVGRTLNTVKSLLICTLLLLASKAMAQNIITVDNNPGSTAAFTSVQAALDSASPNDVIYVQPSGISYGNINIDKPITLAGRSHSEPSKVSALGNVFVRSSDVTIKGLNMNALNHANGPNPIPFDGLEVFDCSMSNPSLGFGSGIGITTANNIIIRGNVINGSLAVNNDAKNVLISNNILPVSGSINHFIHNALSTVISNNIFRINTSPITFTNFDTHPVILSNNMFIFTFANAGNPVVNLSRTTVDGGYILNNNLTYAYGGGTVSFTGGGIIENNTLASTDPLFTNVDILASQSFAGTGVYNPSFRLADDLSLQEGSPALTGGTGGSEIGLYNNGFLYKTLGVPRGIPTLDVLSYDGSVPKNSNINVIIKAKAH